ncbi:MAG TPA: SprT family zinc-dependent metalloprotease [Candidatus Eisenbacteria bacterium]|nr:SprT family zinc-dependent metalloprotease [Candidatus Eisenbacteria bacterium]
MAQSAAIPIVESEHRLRLAATSLPYTVRRTPRARGLRVTIDPRRGVVVTIPPSSRRGWARADDRVEGFLRDRAAWVVRHVARLERDRAEVLARGGARDGGQIHYRGELHRIRDEAGPRPLRRSVVERVGGTDGDELVIRRGSRDRRPAARIIEAWLRARAAEAIDRAVAEHAAALRVTPAVIALRDPRTRWGSASRTGRLMFSWRLILAPPGALETVVVHELAHLRVFGHRPKFWALVASRRPDHLADRAWLRRHSHALHASLELGEALDVA